MSEDYEFHLVNLKGAYAANQITEDDYKRNFEMMMDSDGECLERLIVIIQDFLDSFKNFKNQKISERLVIGAEKIEATEDPKEKARLMIHYNNLLKELSA